MERFLVKKKRDADDEETSAAKEGEASSGRHYVFVIAPGASGGDCAELVECLSTIGRTVSIKKWISNFPAKMGENVALLESTIREITKKKDDQIVLVGHSFGCRVIVELLAKSNEWPAVLESYPLFGPSKPKHPGTDRLIALSKLPKNAHILALSGINDDFLSRPWVEGTTGVPALDAALKGAVPSATIIAVDKAKHNILKVAKKYQLTNRGILLSAISSFLSASSSSSEAEDTAAQKKRKISM